MNLPYDGVKGHALGLMSEVRVWSRGIPHSHLTSFYTPLRFMR